MAKINKMWYFAGAVLIVGVILIVYFSVGTSNSVSDSGNNTSLQIEHNSTLATFDNVNARIFSGNTPTEIRVWPKSLPKPPYCGKATGTDKIVGGRVLEFDEQPWAALLEFRYDPKMHNDNSYDCGGTLINNEYVVTAAHCLHDTTREIAGVLLGEQDLFNDIDCLREVPSECAIDKPILYAVAQTFIHPQYNNETKHNDIALVKLTPSVIFNEITKPICLPDEDFYTHDLGKVAFAVGWGLTNSSDILSESNVKQIVDLPVWDAMACAQKFKTISTQLCAGGEKDKDSCTYDSGGPLVRLAHISPAPSWFLEGIVSYGFNEACGKKDYPGVYTKVSAYMDWILDTISR